MPKQQKSRAPKTSSGNGIKHRKAHLTPLQLVLMNKGPYRKIKNMSDKMGARKVRPV